MIPTRDRPLGQILGFPHETHAAAPATHHLIDAARHARLADLTTNELAAAACAGDTEAVGALYDRLVGPIYRYVVLRVRHPHDAEDLTQLVFERLVTALPRYRPSGSPFEAWAFRIARNAVIDHARRARRDEALDETHERSHGDGLDALAVRGEEIRELRAAVARLTPDQQEALALRFAAGLSADDAAKVMGRQAGTIRGLTFRAIGALRRHLHVPDPK
jgi:RNA polymerase sigma-70 factor (ECF subfamily)